MKSRTYLKQMIIINVFAHRSFHGALFVSNRIIFMYTYMFCCVFNSLFSFQLSKVIERGRKIKNLWVKTL